MTSRAAHLRWWCFLGLGVLAIFWVCTFKIMDRDFWWHITAGRIMLQTGHLITTDPFAYTRAGLPYLATHEWLAQIFLYLIYHLGGPVGIILFRGVIASASVGLLLLLAKKPRIAYIILAVWAVVITKGSYLERPQLFTFILFAAFIHLAFRFLDAVTLRRKLQICAAFIGLELLWVNMHGGAALVGCAIVTFVFLQAAVDAWPRHRIAEHRQTVALLFGTLVLMAITLILPPNGFGTLTYLSQLLSDKTIAFIAEWQPRDWPLYLSELWPFYLLSCAALVTGRKHWVFNGLLLLMTVYLSRQAFRHEILFVFASIATCFYQCDRSKKIEQMFTWMENRRRPVAVTTIVIVLLLAHIAVVRSYGFERQDNLFGFGQFDLARGAADFVEREHITGNMFNTYGIGGYLIYRGYPDRKVFIDGRNVDYGLDYMAHAYMAGLDQSRWKEIEDQYRITYAIVDYDAIKQPGRLPYSSLLDVNPGWALVYLDDWTAVYLKKVPENQDTIDRLQYHFVSATSLQFHDDFADVSDVDMPKVIAELHRVQKDNPEGVKATVALAKIALHDGRTDDAKDLITTAIHQRPYSPDAFAVMAGVFVRAGQWEQAARAFGTMLSIAGDNYPNINYAYIADVYEKANHPWKAWYLRIGLPPRPMPTFKAGTGSSIATQKPSLSVNPGADAQEYNDRALSEAQSGALVEAEEDFRTSLKLNPSNAETWNNLCALLLNLKRNTEAIDVCKKAIEIDKEYGDALYNLALGYFNTNDLVNAKKEALLAEKYGRKKEATDLLLLIQKRTL